MKTEAVYRETYNKLQDKDYLDSLDDEAKDENGLTERDRYIAELKATAIGEQTYIDVDRRIEAIENNGSEFQDAWVEHGKKVDEFGGSSNEVKYWFLDNPEAHKWARSIWEDKYNPTDWVEPIIRINVDYAKQDDEYDAIETPEERKRYLFPNGVATDYCVARYTRQSYEKDIPDAYRRDYITWFTDLSITEKPEDYPTGIANFEDNWWMLEHRGFHDQVWVGLLNNQAYPIEMRTKDGVQYLIDVEGKPSRTPPTREMGAKYLEYIRISRGDVKYKGLESKGQGADQYRLDNPDLDEWGVVVGIWAKTMSEKRKQLGETPGERAEREAQELIDWFKEEQERLRQEALR